MRRKTLDLHLIGKKNIEIAEELGISPVTVGVFLKEPEVIEERDRRQKEAAEKANVTAQWVLQEVKDVVIQARAKGSCATALKGLDILARATGLYNVTEMNQSIYNVMPHVLVAPDEGEAKKIIDGKVSSDKMEVLEFNIGEEVP